MRKKRVYLNFKIRQALNVAQAVAADVFSYSVDEQGHKPGQFMSLKENKEFIVFHFERGMTVKVSLIKKPAEKECWLAKAADATHNHYVRGCKARAGIYLGINELNKLKRKSDWGTPEVAGEEAL
ncbi:MAG: hypothetical protein V1770_02305 [bacterium]